MFPRWRASFCMTSQLSRQIHVPNHFMHHVMHIKHDHRLQVTKTVQHRCTDKGRGRTHPYHPYPTAPPPPTPLLVRLRIKCHAPHKQKTKDSSANKNHHFIILSPADTVLKQLETFLNIGFLSNP